MRPATFGSSRTTCASHLRVVRDRNRRAMTRVSDRSSRTIGSTGGRVSARLLRALRRSAPEGVRNPRSSSHARVHNPAYFEHVLLARLNGRRARRGQRPGGHEQQRPHANDAGERPVHVIYRRIDDKWLDPSNSVLTPSWGSRDSSTRAGQDVTIANALGNGVADDKLLYTYVPELIRYFLGEEPLLDNVESYVWVTRSRCTKCSRTSRSSVKPVDGSGGKES